MLKTRPLRILSNSSIMAEKAPDATSNGSSQGSAVRGASLLIMLQIASRAVTFVANQLLLRFLTAQLLGISTQLEVYYLSVLFFARESLRVAIQRQGTTTKNANNAHESQSVVNVGHLSLVLGLGAAVGLGGAYLRYVDDATASTPYLEQALHIYAFAALVELLSEPAFVVLQHRLWFGPRAGAESVATVLKCLVTFGSAYWARRTGRDFGVLPFAQGQLAYGVGLMAVYTWYGWSLAVSEGFSLLPRKLNISPARKKYDAGKGEESYTLDYFYTPTIHLASSMTAQSFVKHILTQGDTFLVSVLSNTQSQGIYALANNYGSLLARLVFQPVEESSRNYFSKLLSRSNTDDKAAKPTLATPSKSNLIKAKSNLQSVFKAYLLLSIIIVTLGPYGAPLLVQLIAGRSWASSGACWVLAQYCFYIPLLALNGISEAFVSSVASSSETHRQSVWMGAFSVTFGVAGFVFLRVLDLGAVGLVYANSINMLCRIIWSGTYITRWFGKRDVKFSWGDVLPSGLAVYFPSTAALWQAFILMGVSLGSVSSHVFRDIILVAGLALPYVGLVTFMERHYLNECYRSFRGSPISP